MVSWITRVEEVQFESFQCHTFQIGFGKHYPCPILVESLGTILEAQFALDQEGLEFLGVCAIKGVQFMDFGTGGRGIVGMAGGMREVVDSDGKVVKDSQTRV